MKVGAGEKMAEEFSQTGEGDEKCSQNNESSASSNFDADDSSRPSKAANDASRAFSERNIRDNMDWLDRHNLRYLIADARAKEVQLKLRRQFFNMLILGLFCGALVFAFVFASVNNPGLYDVDKETLKYLNRFFNATLLLVMPFVLGFVGAFSRILISGMKYEDHMGLLAASGLFSAFSWIGIKSGVLLKIVAPHLSEMGIEATHISSFDNQFYTMALVALGVGMFSTNLYIFVNQKIELILSKEKATN